MGIEMGVGRFHIAFGGGESKEVRKARKAVIAHWQATVMELLAHEVKVLEDRYGIEIVDARYGPADTEEMKRWWSEAVTCHLKGQDLPPIPRLESGPLVQ